MKIILFSRQGVVHTAGDLHQMFDAIARFGFDYAVNEEFAPQIERLTGISIDAAHRYGRPMGPQPAESVLVCYGGDGTLLDGIHRLGGAEIPVIGINSGHLGFLTSVPRNGCIGDVFELIAAGRLDGVEIDHPRNTPEDRAELTRLAKENGLIVTGGTDYHGINTVTPRPVGAFTTSDEMIARIGDIAKARKSTYKRQK